MEKLGKFLHYIIGLACAVVTAMVGYTIHGSIGWAVADFIFWPFAWCKWLVCKEVSVSIIKATFAFLLQ